MVSAGGAGSGIVRCLCRPPKLLLSIDSPNLASKMPRGRSQLSQMICSRDDGELDRFLAVSRSVWRISRVESRCGA